MFTQNENKQKQTKLDKVKEYLHAAFYDVNRNNCGVGSSTANDTAQAA